MRVAGTDRKVAQGILARSARVDTHLIPEVRPYRANALRCSKTLPAFLSLARDALLLGPSHPRFKL